MPNQEEKVIILESADRYNYIKKDSGNQFVSLVGNAFVRQGSSKFYADSMVLNQSLNQLEAFGHVHINDADTIHTYSNYLIYKGNEKKANLKESVYLTDGKGELRTPELDYDLNTRLATYNQGGKLINGKTVLTSREAVYNGNTKDVYFRKKVLLINPEGRLYTDTLLYNIDNGIATFLTKTKMLNGKRTIETNSGYYDLKNKKASFGKRPIVEDSTYTFTSDDANIDDVTGISEYKGNALYKSKNRENGYDLIANFIHLDKRTSDLVATDNPILIIHQPKDSIYITADTLRSGKLANLAKTKDIPNVRSDIERRNVEKQGKGKEKNNNHNADTSASYFLAYQHVKIFSDSLQAACDSFFYGTHDSTFRLFNNPVLWSSGNQIIGDTMYLYISNNNPERLLVYRHALAIQKLTDKYFNQIKGNALNAYFEKGRLYQVHTSGDVEIVYYGVDDKGLFVAVNKSSCEKLDMYFKEGAKGNTANKIVMRDDLKGTTFPVRKVNINDMQLTGFKWLYDGRPKTKFVVNY